MIAFSRIGPRRQACSQSIVDMSPMIRADILRRKAKRLDGIDGAQNPLNFVPACRSQKNFSAGLDGGDSGIGLDRSAGAQNIDTRNKRLVTVRRPVDECENRSRREVSDASPTVERAFIHGRAETNPALDLAFEK